MRRAQHSNVFQLCDFGSKALRDPENTLGRGIYTLGKGLRSQTNQNRAASVESGAGTTVGCSENTGQKCLVHLLELPLAPQIPSTAPPPAPVQQATLFSLRQEKQTIRVRHWR